MKINDKIKAVMKALLDVTIPKIPEVKDLFKIDDNTMGINTALHKNLYHPLIIECPSCGHPVAKTISGHNCVCTYCRKVYKLEKI